MTVLYSAGLYFINGFRVECLRTFRGNLLHYNRQRNKTPRILFALMHTNVPQPARSSVIMASALSESAYRWQCF